jgi:predicted transcriptional regulator
MDNTLQNTKVIRQLKVLDNEVKLKILALLTENGAKSITDISKNLNLNFSTAHKYLEQLEYAGFVKSKQETENRLKRMFYIQDFCVHIDPRNISDILKGKNVEHGEEAYEDFNIITNAGELERFNKFKFAKPYLDAGIPKNTIDLVFDELKNKVYNAITLIELRSLFNLGLNKRINLINNALNNLRHSSEDQLVRTIKILYPNIIDLHKKGIIFLNNLSNSKINYFAHDLDALNLYGLEIPPKDFDDFINQLIILVNNVSEHTENEHILDSLNFFIARYTKNLSDDVVKRKILNLIQSLKPKIFISVEYGTPLFIKKASTCVKYPTGSNIDYLADSTEAHRLYNLIIDLAKTNKLNVIIKVWDPNLDINSLPDDVYLANCTREWQGENVVYSPNIRFDTRWKYWFRTVRVGESKEITLNLPYIASITKDYNKFVQEILKITQSCLFVFKNSSVLLDVQNIKLHKIKYTHFDDSSYSISLYGLDSACNILGQVDCVKFSQDLANNLYKIIKNSDVDLRVDVKSVVSDIAKLRISSINKFKKIPEYHIKHNIELASNLHKYFLGGHFCEISKNELLTYTPLKLFKKDWGLIRVR